MEFREIIYVYTVAEEGNLTKAAERLHISQPSLSQSIKTIENRLGFPLFKRSKKGMSLTTYGERFIVDANDLINAYRTFEEKLSHYGNLGHTYHIGLFNLVHTTPLQDLVMTYIAEHNTDRYTMHIDTIPQLESLLLKGHLDLALIKYSPIYKRSKQLTYISLYQQAICVLINKHHPLSQKKSLKMKDLNKEKILTSSPKEYPYQMIQFMMADSGILLDPLVSTNYTNLTMIMDFVSKGMGITFATEDVCRHYESDTVTWLPLYPEYYYDYCIVLPKKAGQGQLKDLVDYILRYINHKICFLNLTV